MIIIETYYLIDFENVRSGGLSGSESLKKTDHIIIFFTHNAGKIDMNALMNTGDADISYVEVPVGKQSADFHICSYLGYLAGKNEGKGFKVVIVSKDTGFDLVLPYWNKKPGIEVKRLKQVSEKVKKENKDKKPTAQKTVTPKISKAKKNKLNQEVLKALQLEGYDVPVPTDVAKMVTGLYGKPHLSVSVHNELRKNYNNYLEIYETIKQIIAPYDTVTVPENEKTKLNNEIMEAMAKGAFETTVINYVASTVVKNKDAQNGKQTIYRSIISKYGQKRGLNIYNHIRKHI